MLHMFSLKRIRWLVPIAVLVNYVMQGRSELGQSIVYYLFTIYFAVYVVISLIHVIKDILVHGGYIAILLLSSEIVFKKEYEVVVSNSFENIKELVSDSIATKSKKFIDKIRKATVAMILYRYS